MKKKFIVRIISVMVRKLLLKRFLLQLVHSIVGSDTRPCKILLYRQEIVTQDNVLDLFDEISRSDDVESHRQQYSALVQLYRDLPKDMFLSRILSDYNADEKQLYELRSNLFAELKSIEKCPFAPGTELKRRKNTTRGEGVHVKPLISAKFTV